MTNEIKFSKAPGWRKPFDAFASLKPVSAALKYCMPVLDRPLMRLSRGRISLTYGLPTLLLTTTGRKSGKEFTTPVNGMRDGDNYVVVASLAGYDVLPHWYLNLENNPRVWIQEKDKKVPATARTLTREEKAPLWPRLLAEGQPLWAYFQMFTEREFPVVLVTPEK